MSTVSLFVLLKKLKFQKLGGKCLEILNLPDYPKVGEGDYTEWEKVPNCDQDHHIAPGENTSKICHTEINKDV